MSTSAPMTPGGLPRGDLLGRFRSYEEAQKVVDRLAQAESFDVKSLSIVGNDLRSVESVRSRLSYPRVAGAGAAQGAMFGFFIGLLIWLFAPESPVLNLALAVLLGMAIWMVIGVISYAVRRGKRDFASSSQLVATTYDVVCDARSAGRARHILGPMPLPGQVTGSVTSTVPEHTTAHPGEQSGQVNEAAIGESDMFDHDGPADADPSPTEARSDGASPDGASPDGASAEQLSPDQQAAQARGGYRDLPDGRPRYGVRREDIQD